MSTERQENIMGALVGFALVAHVFSYFLWSYVKVVNIYYVSMYFLLLNLGGMLMLINRGAIVVRYLGVGMFTFGGTFLYMEFAGDPQDWTKTNVITFVFIAINSLLFDTWIERYKKRKANE